MIYTHLLDDLYVRQFAVWLNGEAPTPEPMGPLPDLPEDPVLAGPVRQRPVHPFSDRRTRAWLAERRRARRGINSKGQGTT